MTDLSALLSVIQSLEIRLHQPMMRNNAEFVENLLHKDFEEIGRSGQCYNKQQTVAALKMESGHAQIFSEDFKLTMIAEGVALLRYKSFQLDTDDKVIRQTERLSIWLLSALEESDGKWQMRFHQGTAIDK